MKRLLIILLILIVNKVFSQTENVQYYEDYIQACELISCKYIYLERKLDITREDFLRERKKYANSIQWDNEQFINEIRNLRCRFPDGHFSWRITKELSPFDGFYTLGFVCTFSADGLLIVKKIYPYYNHNVQTNDTITHINGIEAVEYIKDLGQKDPQSTLNATLEVAARNLTLIKYFSPTLNSITDIEIEIRNGERIEKHKCKWKRCGLTSDISEAIDNEQILLVQRNGYLSLEEIPTISSTVHPSFYLYSKKLDSLSFSILHIRDFTGWDTHHIDRIIGIVLEENPDYLLIDLKDCSGGSFNNMLFLSHALNLTKSYEFFYDIITNEKKRVSGVSNFDFISEKIEISNKWKGKVIVRTNEICGSACDFFTRHLKVNNRAIIVGTAPAGRGGGTDTFTLKNTQTEISFPLRERIPVDYLKSIESDVMKIDYFSEKEITDLIIDLMHERIITPHNTQ
jgi:hypothetical protein